MIIALSIIIGVPVLLGVAALIVIILNPPKEAKQND